jgi:hypothetical protein
VEDCEGEAVCGVDWAMCDILQADCLGQFAGLAKVSARAAGATQELKTPTLPSPARTEKEHRTDIMHVLCTMRYARN